jgi:deoxyribodipyrimidine photolyase
MADLIWMHEDMLRADHPVFAATQGAAQAVFLWDDAYLDAMHYGLKRRMFIYETLCALPVEIYRGDSATGLLHLAEAAGSETIYSGATPNPALQAIAAKLEEKISVQWVADDAFVHLSAAPDLQRFFRYWNKARKTAFRVNGAG